MHSDSFVLKVLCFNTLPVPESAFLALDRRPRSFFSSLDFGYSEQLCNRHAGLEIPAACVVAGQFPVCLSLPTPYIAHLLDGSWDTLCTPTSSHSPHLGPVISTTSRPAGVLRIRSVHKVLKRCSGSVPEVLQHVLSIRGTLFGTSRVLPINLQSHDWSVQWALQQRLAIRVEILTERHRERIRFPCSRGLRVRCAACRCVEPSANPGQCFLCLTVVLQLWAFSMLDDCPSWFTTNRRAAHMC